MIFLLALSLVSGNDTDALIKILDAQSPAICQLADAAVDAGWSPEFVIEHGTESFANAFDPSQTVIDHMHLILTICVS